MIPYSDEKSARDACAELNRTRAATGDTGEWRVVRGHNPFFPDGVIWKVLRPDEADD